MSELISCIIPVFNGELYLTETIENTLAQTHAPLEIIVVDDGSTDRSARIAEGFGPPVRCISQSNQGHAAARNLGLQHATADFIAFQDADDLWHPRKLELQMEVLRHRASAGGCVVHVRNFGDDGASEATRSIIGQRRAEGVVGFTFPSLLAHRWVFDRIGAFDESLGHCDDTDWFLRARTAGVKIEVLPEVLAFRRMHETNRSRIHANSSVDEYLELLKRHLDKQRFRNG
jgi:glycosyltransferase involved in cell wall biosynthesis